MAQIHRIRDMVHALCMDRTDYWLPAWYTYIRNLSRGPGGLSKHQNPDLRRVGGLCHCDRF